ncbi:putative zinc finger protein [Sesbania bispinosa]|nr:putative zinc finger protein [Sesbania bispinosa]
MSPETRKKTTSDLKKEAEEKHARAMRIRSELENERVQKLQRTSQKLNRVNEWHAIRHMKLEGMHARHQRSESRHEAYLAQVVKRAGDESSKVNEVRFITSLNEENKKLILRQKLHESELRRAEKLQVIKSKQKEDLAREEAVLERRKLIEAEKLQRLAEMQRKKEEAQVRREEERKASSAAREARAIEQLRRKEERAKAQQEEAELLAQKLAERLNESEQRRKIYLEQIRERANLRDQSSPLLRRSLNKEGQGRSTPTNSGDDSQTNITSGIGSSLGIGNITLQHSMKRRIKRIRQRLMALKYEFLEPPLGGESAGIGYRVAVGAARAKVGRWLQELQRLRQARKEGATSIGLIISEMIKYLEGKDPELHASRQAGLLDFIASVPCPCVLTHQNLKPCQASDGRISISCPILLSVHLLVVLTSRPGKMSYIDWESSPVAMEQEIGSEGAKFADSAHSVVNNSWGDYNPLSVINGSSVMHLPDVPEDRPLDEIIKVNMKDESISVGKDCELEHDSSVKLKNDETEKIDDLDESKKNQSGDIANSSVPQKDEKHTMPVVFLLSAVSETGLVSLPSLLTAVLLHANNRSSSEQASSILPSNFEEVAAGVLKVLNNVALLDLVFCSECWWKAPNDQVNHQQLEKLLINAFEF